MSMYQLNHGFLEENNFILHSSIVRSLPANILPIAMDHLDRKIEYFYHYAYKAFIQE